MKPPLHGNAESVHHPERNDGERRMSHRNARTTSTAAGAAAAVVAAAVLVGCAQEQSDAGDARQVEPRGKQVFIAAGCSSCHTLRDVGSTGTVGTDLDLASPDAEHVERFVTNGGVGMPSFDGVLTPEDIRAVARYVASVTGR